MFANRKVTAMIPAKDLARAKAWYSDKLGLTPSSQSGDAGVGYTLGGGTQAFLYETQFAGTAQHTILGFECFDLNSDVEAMRAKGVVFLDYDVPGLKTVGGIAEIGPTKSAWCKDSEGNILGFVEGM